MLFFSSRTCGDGGTMVADLEMIIPSTDTQRSLET